jgi:hypothetical protein
LINSGEALLCPRAVKIVAVIGSNLLITGVGAGGASAFANAEPKDWLGLLGEGEDG